MFCGQAASVLSLQYRLRLRSPTSLLCQQSAALAMQTSNINWVPFFFHFTFTLYCRSQGASGSTLGSRNRPPKHLYSSAVRSDHFAVETLCSSSVSLPAARCAPPSAGCCEPLLATIHLPLLISLFIPQPAYRSPFRSYLIPVMLYPMQTDRFSPVPDVCATPADPLHDGNRPPSFCPQTQTTASIRQP